MPSLQFVNGLAAVRRNDSRSSCVSHVRAREPFEEPPNGTRKLGGFGRQVEEGLGRVTLEG